jgi:hypothetical protein
MESVEVETSAIRHSRSASTGIGDSAIHQRTLTIENVSIYGSVDSEECESIRHQPDGVLLFKVIIFAASGGAIFHPFIPI